jgi:Flp pilus assembly pilin Flp
MIEYAILTGIIAVGVITALTTIGSQVLAKFTALVGTF